MQNQYKLLAIEGTAKDSEEAIRCCGQEMTAAGYVNEGFVNACIKREKEFPTGIECKIPVAIPHCKHDGINENCICLLRLKNPVIFKRMDDSEQELETKLIFCIAIKAADDHLKILQKLMSIFVEQKILQDCLDIPQNKLVEYLSNILEL